VDLIWHYPLLAVVGLVAGFQNVMAGGGSLLTLPVMIFLGLSPAEANGTNRVALLTQSVTAVVDFRRQGFSDWRRSLTLALCTVPGAVAGAVAAVKIDPVWFKRFLALVMIGVLVLVLRKPRTPAEVEVDESGRRDLVLAHLAMLGVGFYGGFIQAGVGFILMAILRGLLRLDLVRVNMHKVFVVGVYMLPSLAVFALLDQVLWVAGLVLAVGNGTGAFIATRLQVKKGEGPVRVVFAIAIVAMAVKLVVD
jgi:uncharacterized membrane protein YfcA